LSIDKSYNYRVLRAVSFLQPETAEEGGVTADAVSQHTGLSERRARAVCGHLAGKNHDCGNPWLYPVAVSPKQYRVSTGGELELDSANDDPRLPSDAESWIDKVRWPSEERYSRLENVAIPTGSSRGGDLDADYAAWRQARGLLEHDDDIDEDELKDAWRRF
jgi:hypothetical protein